MIIFDYIFYRIYDFYFRKEKGYNPFLTASGYLSFLQFLLIYCILMLYVIVLEDKFNVIECIRSYKTLGKVLIFSMFIVLEIFNILRYRKKDKRDVLQKRFNRYPLNKIIKPWMFLLLGVLLFGLPILTHYLIS